MLQELLLRERHEKLATVELFATLLGAGLGIKQETLGEMLVEYAHQVTQARYRPSMLRAVRQKKADETRQKVEMDRLLKKVESLTVEDGDLPPQKEARRRR